MQIIRKIKFLQSKYFTLSRINNLQIYYFSMQKKKKSPPLNKTEIIKEEIPKSIYKKNDNICIMVNAKPNSKINAITGINDEAVDISVAAPAKDNEANTELLEYLSEILGIKKTNISLDKGGKSRSKLFILEESDFSPSEIYNLFKNELN